MQLGQSAGVDGGGDLGGRRGNAPVKPADLGDQLPGQLTQDSKRRDLRAHRAQWPDRDVDARARGAPAGMSWVSSTCSRLIVFVRVLTKSSRCLTSACRVTAERCSTDSQRVSDHRMTQPGTRKTVGRPQNPIFEPHRLAYCPEIIFGHNTLPYPVKKSHVKIFIARYPVSAIMPKSLGLKRS